jgi:hypothetical protein
MENERKIERAFRGPWYQPEVKQKSQPLLGGEAA